MIRYELCIWPEKQRVVIRYTDADGRECEVSEESLRAASFLHSVKVTDAEVAEEIIRQTDDVRRRYSDSPALNKKLSLLRTAEAKKNARLIVENRKIDTLQRLSARKILAKSARKIQKRFERVIRGL